MGTVVNLFPSGQQDLREELARLRTLLDELDAREPEDMDSEEYEQWGDAHEELEDQIDDILDLLDDRE